MCTFERKKTLMKRISICLIILAASLVVNSCAKKEDSVKHVNGNNRLVFLLNQNQKQQCTFWFQI